MITILIEVIRNMSSDRFLLIKAWSYTLWADIDHVLCQLLIAEITNRIPVIYWPTQCLYNGFIQTNGFELYFEPISNYTIYHLVKPEYTYYPPIWDQESLLADDRNRDTWMYRNIGDILSSTANVVVGDAYYNVSELTPFLKKNHSAYGMDAEQIYHYLFSKYIRIKPDIETSIQNYYFQFIKDNYPVLAVHVRKVDKSVVFDARNVKEYGNQYWNKVYKRYTKKNNEEKIRKIYSKGKIKKPNDLYHSEIRKYVQKFNIKKIFLLTDCDETINEYKKQYGSMLLFTNCKRSIGDDSSSYMENPMIKRQRGAEIIRDTYIAAKCDFFIGNDFSHLSHTVMRLKDWGDKSTSLLFRWYKGLKYPLNVMLIVKKESNNIFVKIKDKAKKLIDKYKKKLVKGDA